MLRGNSFEGIVGAAPASVLRTDDASLTASNKIRIVKRRGFFAIYAYFIDFRIRCPFHAFRRLFIILPDYYTTDADNPNINLLYYKSLRGKKQASDILLSLIHI